MMISVSDQDFHNMYWPKLESAVHLILQQNPGEFIPISYEEMYSAVYKCVCQQHSDKLYKNLMHLITNTLMKINNDLESQPMEMYLERFSHIMSQYYQSVEGIAAIFNYMNRFYVKPKMFSDLKLELLAMFSTSVADNEKLFEILSQTTTHSFAVDPKLLMSVVQGLYTLKPEFAKKIPALSSRFIPNFSPHCTSLENEIDETNELQHELSKNEEFVRGENLRKRGFDCIISDASMEGPSQKI